MSNSFREEYPEDIVASVRNELYIVASFLLSLDICADHQFHQCEEEAAVLIHEAQAKVKQLLADADEALKPAIETAEGAAA